MQLPQHAPTRRHQILSTCINLPGQFHMSQLKRRVLVLTQRTHFGLGLRLLYLRGLRRHVGEGDLDGVLDAVQQLDDHVRHHLERGPVLARRVAHHGVAHLER